MGCLSIYLGLLICQQYFIVFSSQIFHLINLLIYYVFDAITSRIVFTFWTVQCIEMQMIFVLILHSAMLLN